MRLFRIGHRQNIAHLTAGVAVDIGGAVDFFHRSVNLQLSADGIRGIEPHKPAAITPGVIHAHGRRGITVVKNSGSGIGAQIIPRIKPLLHHIVVFFVSFVVPGSCKLVVVHIGVYLVRLLHVAQALNIPHKAAHGVPALHNAGGIAIFKIIGYLVGICRFVPLAVFRVIVPHRVSAQPVARPADKPGGVVVGVDVVVGVAVFRDDSGSAGDKAAGIRSGGKQFAIHRITVFKIRGENLFDIMPE